MTASGKTDLGHKSTGLERIKFLKIINTTYTDTLFFRRASFKEVLRSVLDFLFPMIKAQLILYSPAGNFLVMDPGTTTDLSGT